MRILLVEDEEKVSRLVAGGLTAERFAVDIARDGKDGWDLAQTYQYDLIILDLMLPGLTGGEVLNRVRKANSQVPVLVLTARDSLGDKIAHFEAGADDYLTKPFAFAELLVRVKFDPGLGRIYAACSSGFISVFHQDDADHYRKLEDFPVQKMVHSLAVDTATHRVYAPELQEDGQPVARMIVYEAIDSTPKR